MISPGYCQLLALYNSKMNQQLYSACSLLPDELRKSDIKLFFISIHGTLNHLLYGDIAWLSRFLGRENDVPTLGEELYADFSELAAARTEWDKKIISWTNTISPEWLGQDFTFVSKVDQQSRTRPAWLLVAHMFNHATHHRGQITAALSQLDVDYGVTDIPFLIEK